jgi:hypothetical protein
MTDVPARREESERVGLARIVGTDAQPSAIARLTEPSLCELVSDLCTGVTRP